MGGKSTPATPDYAGAAREQAQSSREVTEQQSWANRPDQFSPFGSTTWQNQSTWDPSTQQYLNRWAQDTNVAPELQGALDNQFNIINARSQLGSDLTGRLQSEMGTPMDWSQFRPSGQGVEAQDYGDINSFRGRQEDALYGKATSRLDPMWGNRQNDMRSQLYNMGAREGDPAYERAMREFGRDRNDAYDQAMFSSIAGGGAETANQINMGGAIQGQQQASSSYDNQLRQQDIAEALQQRGASLNEINAAMTGQQVGMPSMPSFSQAQGAQPLQALSAAQMTGQSQLDAYNAQQAGTQGMLSGITGVGGMFMGRP